MNRLIVQLISAVIIFAGLVASFYIGPNMFVLYASIAILVVFGLPEILAVIGCLVRNATYFVDYQSVFSSIAAGYIIINYFI